MYVDKYATSEPDDECSGYPGIIYSGDDFTVASSGLTILETTIGRYINTYIMYSRCGGE